jgi:hypothetical protein
MDGFWDFGILGLDVVDVDVDVGVRSAQTIRRRAARGSRQGWDFGEAAGVFFFDALSMKLWWAD